MNHFTFTGDNELGVELVLIQTFQLCYANHVDLIRDIQQRFPPKYIEDTS